MKKIMFIAFSITFLGGCEDVSIAPNDSAGRAGQSKDTRGESTAVASKGVPFNVNVTSSSDITVTSRENDLTIRSIEVNRGNCHVNEKAWTAVEMADVEPGEEIIPSELGLGGHTYAMRPQFPATLRFAEESTFHTNCRNEVLEVIINTNHGSFAMQQ